MRLIINTNEGLKLPQDFGYSEVDIPEQADPPNPGNKTIKKLDYGKFFPDNPADTDPLWKKVGKMVVNVPG